MMPQSIAFLGRQPSISLAELESVLGAQNIISQNKKIAFLKTPAVDVPVTRLGGTQKVVNIVATTPSTNWKVLAKSVQDFVLDYSASLDEGKLTLALSLHGTAANPKDIEKCLLTTKKALKATGRSTRIVTSREPALSTAQTLHNGLAKGNPHKIELNLIQQGSTVYLGITSWVQDLDAYTRRDRERPARDAKVGMLPPKLAQILINLATGPAFKDSEKAESLRPEFVVLDPFCGTGVVLQEATLMGYSVYGTDLEPRMIEYTEKNLNWLEATGIANEVNKTLEIGDATNHHWTISINAVAGETYLGKPLFKPASPEELAEIVPPVDKIHTEFLKHVHSYLKKGDRIAIGVPAWALKNGEFKHLPTLDSLEEIGYNRLDFVHTTNKDLVYHRPGQAVAREILVLQVK